MIPSFASRPYVAAFLGQKIQSLCIGLSAKCGKLTAQTSALAGVFGFLTNWLRRDEVSGSFEFTSITLNKGYAVAKHRYIGNIGDSVAHVLGYFSCGDLWWCPDDVGRTPATSVKDDRLVKLPADRFTRFDGHRVHCVGPFVGERFSVIFFTSGTNDVMDDDAKSFLGDWGAWTSQ